MNGLLKDHRKNIIIYGEIKMALNNDLVTSICIELDIKSIDSKVLRRLKQILGRDARGMRKYLDLIEIYEKDIFEEVKNKKTKKTSLKVDLVKLDTLTLTTKKSIKDNRIKVPHDLKKLFPRISHNELLECRDTAIGMYKAYLELSKSDKTHKRPRIHRTIPRIIGSRQFKLDIENQILSIKDSLDTNLEMNQRNMKRISHRWLSFLVSLTNFDLEKLQEGRISSIRIYKHKSNKKYYCDFAIRKPVKQISYKAEKSEMNKEIALVGIDLGIVQDAVVSVYLPIKEQVFDTYFIKLKNVEDTKNSLNRLNRRYSELQRMAMKRKNQHNIPKKSADVFVLLREMRNLREQLKHEICHQISAEIVQYIKHLEQKCGFDIFISMGKLKGIRKKHRKGNGKKRIRKSIHSWAYSKLTKMLQYKLSAEGYKKRFIDVSEAFTSIKCWKCGKKGKRPQQSNFYCSNYNCGWRGNADMNGSINIAKRTIDYFQLTNVINKRRKRLLTNKSLSKKVRGQGVVKPTPAELRLVAHISKGMSAKIDQSNRAKRLKYSNTRYRQCPRSIEILNLGSTNIRLIEGVV